MIKQALKGRSIEVENQVLHQRLDKKYSFGASWATLDAVGAGSGQAGGVLEQRIVGRRDRNGKELIAQAIIRTRSFLAVLCAGTLCGTGQQSSRKRAFRA